MRCHCSKELETYEHFISSEQYQEIDGPMVRHQEILLFKKGEKGRQEVEREMRRDGHRKELQHMVIVKSVSSELKKHTMAPEVMAYQLLIRAVEHLQEGMMCREAHGEARAD